MDIAELHAFVLLGEILHIGKTANQCNMSPSALSRLLQRLEEELQTKLFERDTRQMKLTEEGLLFLDFAKETVHKKEDLFLKFQAQGSSLRGIVRIYASVTACYSVLPPFVEELAKVHPQLKLSVQTGDPADAAEAVREGLVELALDAHPEKGFIGLDFFPIKETPLVLIASKTGPYYSKIKTLSENPKTQLKEILATSPFVLPKAGLARDRFNKIIKKQNIKPLVAAETAGNEAILALTRLGLGIGLVPEIVLQNSPFAEGLLSYNPNFLFGSYEIGFIQKPNNIGSDIQKRFRTALGSLIIQTYMTTVKHAH